MLWLKMLRKELKAYSPEQFTELVVRLSDEYKPLISQARGAMASALSVNPDALIPSRDEAELYLRQSVSRAGEIFTDGQCLLIASVIDAAQALYYVQQDDGDESKDEKLSLQIALISSVKDAEAKLAQVQKISEQVFGKGFSPYLYRSSEFATLKSENAESAVALPTDDTYSAAAVLSNRDCRTLAIAVKASGGLLERDIQKQLSPEIREKAPILVQELKDAKLVESEIVVICSKTQAQVARAPSREIIKELAEKRVKCACGRSLSEERAEEALSITNSGRILLDKARWMSVLLVQELEAVGIPRDCIFLEARVGGDEMDCVADVSGELVLFELKDKEFSLGNAYSFGAKIAIIKPNRPVIVTTEKVANDAKEHFVRAGLSGQVPDSMFSESRSGIHYIEGIDSLRLGLEMLATTIFRNDAVNLLGRVLPLVSVDGAALFDAFESARTGAVERKAEAERP
ncbi:MAG: hypothetical protein ISP90_02945 [Nevskia sp.]|nr:hypothetical protein [Nevskia sp.]